jgi:hypothetical protein
MHGEIWNDLLENAENGAVVIKDVSVFWQQAGKNPASQK